MALLLRAASLVALASFVVACGGEEPPPPDGFASAMAAEPDQSAFAI